MIVSASLFEARIRAVSQVPNNGTWMNRYILSKVASCPSEPIEFHSPCTSIAAPQPARNTRIRDQARLARIAPHAIAKPVSEVAMEWRKGLSRPRITKIVTNDPVPLLP